MLKRRTLVAGLVALSLWSIGCAGAQKTDVSTAPTLVLNITSGQDNAHALTMALELANHALDQGRQVVLFLNVKGPQLAGRNLPGTVKLADDTPAVKDLLAQVINRGVTVLVCPHCLHVMGMKEDELIGGVELATAPKLFSRLGPNTVVFTY